MDLAISVLTCRLMILNSIVRESVRLMDIMVESAVLTVNVCVYARIDHRVIQGGVKHSQLVIASFRVDDGERLIPSIGGFGG